MRRGTLYDAEVRIDFLTDVFDWNRGWQVNVKEDCCDVVTQSTAIRVSTVGNSGIGKTWLIKKLCEEPQSATDDAPGLSVKITCLRDQSRVCFLDTAAGSPLTMTAVLRRLQDNGMHSIHAMEEMLREMHYQEILLRDLAFEFGEVHLVVIGQLSRREQSELLQLIERCCHESRRMDVIVVHNLKTMTYDEFKFKCLDARTNTMPYLMATRSFFQLVHRTREIQLGEKMEHVDELNDEYSNAVRVRHLFLTKEELDAEGQPKDKQCKNQFVIAVIRELIRSRCADGNLSRGVLSHLAEIASACVKKVIWPCASVAIRFHNQRSLLLGGTATAGEVVSRTRTSDETFERAREALFRLDAVQGKPDDVLQEYEADFLCLQQEALAAFKAFEVDARTLHPLSDKVQVLLAPSPDSVTVVSDHQIKFHVTRTRSLVRGRPSWCAWVHMDVPGLAPGELSRLTRELQWDRGLTMKAVPPNSTETLKIRFKARLQSMPTKQWASLNLDGRPEARPLLAGQRALMLDSSVPPVVVAAANLPFAANDGMRNDGSYELDVVVHTKVENCMWDVPPVLHYACGVLSLMVCTELTQDELKGAAHEACVCCDDLDRAGVEPDRVDEVV